MFWLFPTDLRLYALPLLWVFLQACAPVVSNSATVKPSKADLEAQIEVSVVAPPEFNFGGELIVLPTSNFISIECRIDDRLPKLYEVTLEKSRLYWECDHGTIFDNGGKRQRLENLWTPPPTSEVSTIKVTYEAEYKTKSGQALPPLRKSGTLQILSPSAPEQFKDGRIDGYEIGNYPDPNDPTIFQRFEVEESNYPRTYPDKYLPVQCFYKITPENVEKSVSKNLTLRFFTMDFPWKSFGYPQYIALDTNVIRKLEDFHKLLNESGIRVTTFKPIYGFRPPLFNLGTIETRKDTNLKVPFSMHQYGKAVDMIVDEDGDNVIDDINGDGVIDVFDPAELAKYANVLDRQYRERHDPALGGAGIYTHHDFVERPIQTPYLHIDTRNYLTSGGGLVRWPAAWPDGTIIQWGKLYPGVTIE